jgi:hypothetical protein
MSARRSNGHNSREVAPAEELTKHAHNSIALTDLQLDDLLARHPDLRREIERAYRAGHVEGWSAAVGALFDYGGDGTVIPAEPSIDTDGTFIPADSDDDIVISPDQINQFSHLLCAWQDGLDDEPAPPHGSAWEPSPTTKDGGLLQWCESNSGDDHE